MASKPRPVDEATFDRLFGQQGAPEHVVAWNTSFGSANALHAESFREAAEILHATSLRGEPTEGLEEGVFVTPSELVRPLLFMARHALELTLKEVIHAMVSLEVMAPKDWQAKHPHLSAKYFTKHDLDQLSLIVEVGLERMGEPINRAWEEIRELCCDWEAADPCGTVFRYAVDPEGHALGAAEILVTHVHVWELWRRAIGLLRDGLLAGTLAEAQEVASELAMEVDF